MVLYVDYDESLESYVAVCDDDRVMILTAQTLAQAEQEAGDLHEEILYDEC